MNININVSCKLISVFLVAIPRNAQSPKITVVQDLCNISSKKAAMNLIFCMQVNIKLSYKLMLWILVGKASNAQSTQKNKFAKSL